MDKEKIAKVSVSTPIIMEDMLGKVFNLVKNKSDNEELVFSNPTSDHIFYHEQDCCEYVRIGEIIGDLKDLEGSPILRAEERTGEFEADDGDSETYTFYEFATVKGSVTVRWVGESNGYYSESVDYIVRNKEGV